MIRKNKRRFDPRYFMDEKTDKKVIKEAEFKYDAPSKTGIPDELASYETVTDFEKYPVTPEELAGEDMAALLCLGFVAHARPYIGIYDIGAIHSHTGLGGAQYTAVIFGGVFFGCFQYVVGYSVTFGRGYPEVHCGQTSG